MEDRRAVMHRLAVLFAKAELLDKVYLSTGAQMLRSDWAGTQALLVRAAEGGPLQARSDRSKIGLHDYQ